MSLTDSTRFSLWSDNAVGNAVQWVQGLIGHRDFSPEEALANTKNIDPRMIPRVKMTANDIDVHLLNELGKMGLKRGKLITAESHPELMQSWQLMSQRAGLKAPPQLILTESKTINALTVTPEEVVVTTGLLKILNLRELTAVLAHELGHETSDHKTPRIIANSIFGTAGAVGGHWLGRHYGLGRWSRGSALANVVDELLCLAVGAFAGNVVANQVAVRPTELEADRKGAAICGDPLALASALRKLEAHQGRRPILNFLAHLQSGYPSAEHRIRNLEEIAARTPIPASQPLAQAAPVIQAPIQPTAHVSAIVANERLGTPVEQNAAIG